ncbi:MAG: ATP synthase F1 subunit delta [Gemmatimonadetes bacterium]|nr:ATP synthase F1 subunit delta [Gemmatimonadota bacterium]
MRNTVVARNYAEALVAAAERHGEVGQYGALLDAVAGAVRVEPRIQAVLESPRVTKAAKKLVLERALQGVAPAPLVRFLQGVVQRGRQGLLGAISEEYQILVDRHLNRVHAGVATARPVDEKLAAVVAERLTRVAGKTVVPHFRTDPSLLGGVVVRIGDWVFDGSLRRKLRVLRYRMLHAPGKGSG